MTAMSEFGYFLPRTGMDVAEEEARLRHEEGLEYGLNMMVKAGRIAFTSIPGYGVTIVFYDIHMRNTWAISWEIARSPNSKDELGIRNFTASCYADEMPDPRRAPKDVWRTVIMEREDGAYMVRYACPASGGLASVERALPRATLPFPAFGDFGPYLKFDYSAFEEAAQNLPAEVFPNGTPPRIPDINSWKVAGE